MAAIEEILTDGVSATALPDDAIAIHAVLIIEYIEPGSDDSPGHPRLAYVSADGDTPWGIIGMCDFVANIERDVARDLDDD